MGCAFSLGHIGFKERTITERDPVGDRRRLIAARHLIDQAVLLAQRGLRQLPPRRQAILGRGAPGQERPFASADLGQLVRRRIVGLAAPGGIDDGVGAGDFQLEAAHGVDGG